MSILYFFSYMGILRSSVFRLSGESRGGFTTPFSVMIPPVIKSAGVTSKAGFQQSISKKIKRKQISTGGQRLSDEGV